MWLEDEFPELVNGLDKHALNLALQRADSLVASGTPRWCAASLAVTLAREVQEELNIDPDELPGPAWHVMFDPVQREWRVCREDGVAAQDTGYPYRDAAIERGCELAQRDHSGVYVHDPHGALIGRFESFGSALPDDRALHVIPYKDHWAIKKQGSDGSFAEFDTKREAVVAGRDAATSAGIPLFIHYRNGDIQDFRLNAN